MLHKLKAPVLLLLISWLIITLFYAHQYFLRVMMGALSDYFSTQPNMTPATIGAISAAFFLAYVLIKIPAGIIIDAFGLRISLSIACFICGMGTLLFAYTSSVPGFFSARMLMGLGGTFSLMGAISFARHWFDHKHFSFLTSVTIGIGILGAIVGGAPLVTLIQLYPIKQIMLVSTLISFILAYFIFFSLKKSDVITTYSQECFKTELQLMLKHKVIWYASLIMGFMYAPIICYFSFWLSLHMHAIYHDSFNEDANAATLSFLGLFFGNLIFSWLGNYFSNMLRVIQAGIILSTILLVMIIYDSAIQSGWMHILNFLFGLAMGASTLIYTYTLVRLPKEVSGTASSLINLFQVGIGAIFLPEIGFMLAHHHQKIHHQLTSLLHYRLSDYHYALAALPISTVIAFVISVFLGKLVTPSHGNNP